MVTYVLVKKMVGTFACLLAADCEVSQGDTKPGDCIDEETTFFETTTCLPDKNMKALDGAQWFEV